MACIQLFLSVGLVVSLLISTSTVSAEKEIIIERDGKGVLLLIDKFISTVTSSVVAYSTKTVYPTCLAGTAGTAACVKKRKRNLTIDPIKVEGSEREILIDGSKNEGPLATESSLQIHNKQGKILSLFSRPAIWTTIPFTTTFTVISTNVSSRVTLSIICNAPSMSVPPAC